MRAFYPEDFRDVAGICARARERAYPASRRASMASLLRRQAEGWDLLEASRASLERFAREDALVVVAGQQPGLFGGPLYTIYKALTAISLARDAERATGRPVVPVFWIASDDHDFEEVRRAFLNDAAPEPQAVDYPLDSTPPGISVARVELGAAIEPLLAAVEALLPATEFREVILHQLRDAYAPGRRWADAFARFSGGWAASLGALVFDPGDVEAKRLAMPIFERELALAGRSAQAARERGSELMRMGYHAQIARAGDELNLFWHGARREAVRVVGDGSLRLTESGRSVAPDALRTLMRESPEDVSPGVLLRPLMQDYLFPTAAYVGGPAEVAYWAQVNALYPLFEMSPPAIVPRSGATLLEPKIAKVIERFGMDWSDLAGDVEAAIGAALKRLLPEDFPALFERERAGWTQSFARLEEAVAEFDPSLKSATQTAAGRVLHEGENLERKLMQVWKRRQEESVLQIRRARGHLFPGGGLQERCVSVVGFAARYGPGLIDRLSRELREPGAHKLVNLGG